MICSKIIVKYVTSHTENVAQQQKVVEEQMYMQNEGLKNKNRY